MKRKCLLLIGILMITQSNAQESDLYVRATDRTSGGEIIQSSIGLDSGRYAILKRKGFSYSVLILDENLEKLNTASIKRLHDSSGLKNIGLLYFDKRLYVHYSSYDQKTKKDKFYVREYDLKSGAIKEYLPIAAFATTKGRIGIFKWGFSPDGTKLWIAYESKSVKSSSQMLMISIVDEEFMNILRVREVLYSKNPVYKPLDYFVDNKGNAYCVGFEYGDYDTMDDTYVTNRDEYTTVLYCFTGPKKDPIKAELQLPTNLISMVKIALNEDNIYLAGYCSRHNNISFAAAFSARLNTVTGSFENVVEYDIPLPLITANDKAALIGRNIKNKSQQAPGIYQHELEYLAVSNSRMILISQEVKRIDVHYMSGSPSKYYHIDEVHATMYGNIIVSVLNESTKTNFVSMLKTWDKEKSHVLRPSPFHIDYYKDGIDVYYLQEYRLFKSSLIAERFTEAKMVFEGVNFDKWQIQSGEHRSDLLKGALIYRKKSADIDYVTTR